MDCSCPGCAPGSPPESADWLPDEEAEDLAYLAALADSDPPDQP